MVKIYCGSKSYFLHGWHWIKIICYSTFYSYILTAFWDFYWKYFVLCLE